MGNPTSEDVPKARVTTPREYIEECLQVHNELRTKHGSPPMAIKEEMCKIAQAWANHLTTIGKMEHSNTEGFGENIYWATNDPSARTAVEKWYSEIKDYNFASASDQPQKGTGHFTQVVWKESVELGVAKATGAKGTYVVAVYAPQGNYMGEFKDNVCSK
ncbi:Golgi-associated plant pathogenesis-related protein 1 [Folsomia candida]|uniref:Golgi-associated plant pathogenesis-related protein 1 n=1 Tax=Folsomia candida TaxID=158441 RepID=A0A226E140_FOLCA|nr:Golgi-associated plant pathogenesis-related protein 1 [Folsomia candida]OXA51179.1 Golgi-associated plant pathogenesis-related protein 1 [Folsomia candida]